MLILLKIEYNKNFERKENVYQGKLSQFLYKPSVVQSTCNDEIISTFLYTIFQNPQRCNAHSIVILLIIIHKIICFRFYT